MRRGHRGQQPCNSQPKPALGGRGQKCPQEQAEPEEEDLADWEWGNAERGGTARGRQAAGAAPGRGKETALAGIAYLILKRCQVAGLAELRFVAADKLPLTMGNARIVALTPGL